MKKTAVLCLFVMLALVVTGIGYSGWRDLVSINNCFNTGISAVGLKNTGTDDYIERIIPGQEGAPDEIVCGFLKCWDENYGYCINAEPYFENIRVIFQGLPGYAPSCRFNLGNSGTIPVRVDQIMLVWATDTAGPTQVGNWSATFPDGQRHFGSGIDSLNMELGRRILEPEQVIMVDMQLLGQQEGYSDGSLSVRYRRWNERS